MNKRHLYPKNWKKLALACKERANWHCEKCNVKHKSMRLSYSGNLYPVYLAAAHKNHDRSNPNPVLICLCPTCHWKHRQKGHRPTFIIERLKLQKARQGVKLCYS
jgi:hypothetical protein